MEKRKVINKSRQILLRGKSWSYLRYLHFRDAISKVAHEIDSICVCGTGHGYAEMAVAAEFPHIQITLTDIMEPKLGYPNYHRTMDMAWKWRIDNLTFSIWDVREPANRKFDLVASTEMLEYIEDDEVAARNMRLASAKYVYCLTPFSDAKAIADPEKKQQAWERHRRFVVGYDEGRLRQLFPNPVIIAGTYWRRGGQLFRDKITKMTDAQIVAYQSELKREALSDLIMSVPTRSSEALGIKILARISC